MSTPHSRWPGFNTLAVVGVGLIGGSFAAALRKQGRVGQVWGVGRRPEALEAARRLGLIDRGVSLEEAAKADLIFLAVPVGAMAEVFQRLRPHLGPHTLLTDGGSTKQDVVAAARAALGEELWRFVPGHPVAGSDQSGPEAASAALYEGKQVVLTPLPENAEAAVETIRRGWETAGARVCSMSPAEHDEVLASISHVPHLLAYAYLKQVAASQSAQRRLAIAGSGFRDFTRIAGSSPEMWRDILIANRTAILQETREIRQALDEIEGLMQPERAERLLEELRTIAEVRQSWSDHFSD
ncbi:MAG: prephenate dehydrogenase/arogenate dehydrogenase family protein [Pigmentiphaga sp.]